MSLADQLGVLDPNDLMTDAVGQTQPDLASQGVVEPSVYLDRLIRKGVGADGRVRLPAGVTPAGRAKQAPAQQPDFTQYGKSADDLANEPQVDLTQFGEEAPAEKAKSTSSGPWVAAKEAAQGAVSGTGAMLQGASVAGGTHKLSDDLQAFSEGVAPVNIPEDQDVTISPRDRVGYKAGAAVKKFAQENIPVSDAEREAHPYWSEFGKAAGGGAAMMGAALGGAALGGPIAGIGAGMAAAGLQGAGDTFEAAKAKGASDDDALHAAGISGAVNGAMMGLPIGMVLTPIKAFGPGLSGWALGKLAQFGANGGVFTAVGEAQHWVDTQIAHAYYDPDAKYDPSLKRAMGEFLAGGMFGVLHPLRGTEQAAQQAAAGAQPDAGAAADANAQPGAGLPPPNTGEAGAQPGTGAGPQPGPQPGTGGAGSAAEPPRARGAQWADTWAQTAAPGADEQTGKRWQTLAKMMQGQYGFADADLKNASFADLARFMAAADALQANGVSRADIRTMTPADMAEAMGKMREQTGSQAEEDKGEPGSRANPINLNTAADVHRAAAMADAEHTHAQGEANNVQRGHAVWNGMPVVFEVAALGTRRGTVPGSGEPWETTHPNAYGYFSGLKKAADGGDPDVVFGNHPNAASVFVIDEIDPKTGKYRQSKSFAGFLTPNDAAQAYAGISSKSFAGIGGMRAFGRDEFVELAKDGGLSKPVTDLKARAEQPKAAEPQQKPAMAADQPTAEPVSDILAQARDLADQKNRRAAVWLPASSVEHLAGMGKLDAIIGSNPALHDFDGRGGILVARDLKTARIAKEAKASGRSVQEIVGRLTGAGTGKPADGTHVVQQIDAQDNVTRERLVRENEVKKTYQAFSQPGRTVQVVSPLDALARRAARVAQEAAPEQGRPVSHDDHHAVAEALRQAGIDPGTVRPADIARAGEIAAHDGIGADEAFPIAVVQGLVHDGHITPEQLKEVVGNESAEAILESGGGNIVGGGTRAPASGPAAGGPAAEAAGDVAAGRAENGEGETRQHAQAGADHGAAGAEANGGIGGVSDTSHQEAGRNDVHPTGGERNAEPTGSAGEIGQRTGQQSADEREAAAATETVRRYNKPLSLLEYIGKRGGLKPNPELTQMGMDFRSRIVVPVQGYRSLIRRNGMSMDELVENLREAGYLEQAHAGRPDDSGLRNEVLNLIDEELRGKKQYPIGSEAPQARQDDQQAEHDARIEQQREKLHAALDTAGMPLHSVTTDLEERAIRLMLDQEDNNQDSDPLDVLEAAATSLERDRDMMADADYADAGVGKEVIHALDEIAAPQDREEAPRESAGIGNEGSGAGARAGEVSSGGSIGAGQEPEAGTSERTEAGEQTVIPGAERIGEADLAKRKAKEGLKPKVAQKQADEGLFGDESQQTDLVDLAKKPGETDIPAADSDETVHVTLTDKGPWDFNDTFPRPDRKTAAALEKEGREFLDPDDAEAVASTLDETLNSAISDFATMRAAGRLLAKAKAGQKLNEAWLGGDMPKRKKPEQWVKELKHDIAVASQSFTGTKSEIENLFGKEAASAFAQEARKRVLQEEQSNDRTDEVKVAQGRRNAENTRRDKEEGDWSGASDDTLVHYARVLGIETPKNANERNLTAEERLELITELDARGAKPRQSGSIIAIPQSIDDMIAKLRNSGYGDGRSKVADDIFEKFKAALAAHPEKIEPNRYDTEKDGTSTRWRVKGSGRSEIEFGAYGDIVIIIGGADDDHGGMGSTYSKVKAEAFMKAFTKENRPTASAPSGAPPPSAVGTGTVEPFNEYGHYKGQRVRVIDNFGRDRFEGTVTGQSQPPRAGVLVREDGKPENGPSTLIESPLRVIALEAEKAPETGPSDSGAIDAKPKKRGVGIDPDRKLRDDWGVERIDGYAETPEFTGQQTDYGVKGGVKDAFLKDASNYLKSVAAELEERGLKAAETKNSKPKAVSINEAGPATTGDVYLNMLTPNGAFLHVQIGGGFGSFPETSNGIQVMYRASAKQYGSTGQNRWAPTGLTARELAQALNAEAEDADASILRKKGQEPHTTVEADHGISPDLSASNAPAGAEDVQPAHPERGNGQLPGHEGGRGEPSVRGTDEGRPEATERLPETTLGEGSRGEGDRGAGAVSESGHDAKGRGERAGERDADRVVGENYRIEPGSLEEDRGWMQKARDNVAALELAKQIETEERPATAAEQRILAKYVGWGGLKSAFPDGKGNFGKGLEKVGARVRELLSDEEYRTAQRSMQYAHYTAEHVVRSIWDGVLRLAGWPEKGIGSVFEPGMGVGNFAGLMPADLHAAYHGIEMDGPTARIAKLLYPKFGVRQADYTRIAVPENSVDLVIGNPPFADTVIKTDPKYAKQGFFLHDYFFAKSLDAVRPGGVLAFISSAGTMNKGDTKGREYLADRADLVGAVRLNSKAFKENAGTEVTTDIIFLRKRFPGEAAGDRSWTETVEVTLPGKDGKPLTGVNSRYFAEHPEMVLGEEGFFDKLYEGRYAVRPRAGQDLVKDLAAAMERLPFGVMRPAHEIGEHAPVDFTSTEKKEGTFYVGPGGELHQMRGGAGMPVSRRGSGVEGGLTAAAIERIKGLIPVRDALRDVYSANLADDAKAGDAARTQLNKHYDAFVDKFGPINKAEFQYRRPTVIQQENARAEAREEARYAGLPFDEGSFDPSKLLDRKATLSEMARARIEAREKALAAGKKWDEGAFDPQEMPDVVIEKRANIEPFMDDPESYRLRAIEHYDDARHTAKKSAIFFENIITKERAPQIKSSADALLYSLSQFGRVNMPEIARLAGKSIDEALEDLGDTIYREPGTHESFVTKDEYLSGDVRKKLVQAKTAAEQDPTFRRNVEALEAAQPTPLAPSQIRATLGMPWIPPQTVEEFGRELGLESLKVRYVPGLAQWFASGDTDSAAAMSTWGTDRRRAPALINDLLNRLPIKIYDEDRDAAGNKTRSLNLEATEAAQQKAQAIREKFESWIWSDPDRTEKLSGKYNEEKNNLVSREYDGSYLRTPGVASHWSWRPHQTRVVARIIQSGNTYMAHAVGAGKTSAMIGAGMEMRRLGLVNKPMYAVPNHMLAQFTKEFYEQYPTAKIAVADERRFHTGRRKQFIANVANEDLDAVIITHSAFGIIPVSSEFADSVVENELQKYRDMLADIPAGPDNRITRSRIEKQIERLEQRLTGRGTSRKDQVFTFEEMGVDFLFVDEAHLFRKLDFATQMGSVKGINPEGSNMAWDLYVKSLYLDSVRPGRNLVLASGTPVTNTMAELYSLSRYLQRDLLAERGMEHFDAWAASHGEPVTELEQDAAGGYKPVTRFARFVNVPELSNMVRQVMDVVTSKQLEQYVVRPKIKGGKRSMRLAEKSPALADYQRGLAERMEAIRRRKGPPQKGDDIMLSVINDGRHAAIDMRLVGAKSDPNSKLNLLVNDVYDIWKATKNQPFHKVKDGAYDAKPFMHGPATQLVFANLGLSGTRGFAVPDYIRSELVRRGVPKNEVQFIYDYKTSVQKQKLFNDMNAGKVRVMIGSTAKMATGVNVQPRLVAIHNLDPLWYPADDEQRNGRGIRQGNMNPEIEIRDYSTKGTYDSVMWGLMEKKARFIQGFFEGDPSLRDMDDLGEASQYEQAKAITTNDPRLIKLTELKQDLEKANRRWAAFDQELHALRSRRAGARSEIAYMTRRIGDTKKDIADRVDTKGDKFIAALGPKKFEKRAEFGDGLIANLKELRSKENNGKSFKLGSVGGFPIKAQILKYPGEDEYYNLIYLELNGGIERRVKGDSDTGLIRSMENVLHGLESDLVEYERGKAKQEKFLTESEEASKAVFTGQDNIDSLSRQVHDLEAELSRNDAEQPHPPEVNPQTIDSLDSLSDLANYGSTNLLEPSTPRLGVFAAMGMPTRDITRTPEFKRWFGDSKVVDGDRPLVVYHGTPETFTEFKKSRFGSPNGEPGFFFTTSHDDALDYGDNVIEAYLSIQKPYELTVRDWQNGTDPSFQEMQRQGYDGVHIEGDPDHEDELYRNDFWVAFEPMQIKSATGNSGAFDPNDPSIAATVQPSRGLTEPAEIARLQEAARRRVLRPAVQARRTQIEAQIQRVIEHIMGPGKLRVSFADTIPAPHGEQMGWGDNMLPTLAGSYAPMSDLLRVAMADPNYADPASAAFHEAWHGVEDHLLDDREMSLLNRELPRLRDYAKRLYGMTDEQAAQLADYEVRAIGFQGYAAERAQGGMGRGLHIGVRAIFEKLMRLFRAIMNALRGLGFRTYEDLFSHAYEGKLAERESRKAEDGSRLANEIVAQQEREAASRRPTETEGEGPVAAMAGFRRTKRPSPGAPESFPTRMRNAIADMLNSRFTNKVVEGAQDLSHPVKLLQDELEQRRGAAFSDVADFYTRKRLYPGRVGNEIHQFEKAHLDPLVKAMRDNDLTMQQAGDYVYAKHVPERNAALGALYPAAHPFNQAMYDPTIAGASGRSRAWAENVIDEAKRSGKQPALEDVANRMQAIRHYVLDKMQGYHLITPEQRAAWLAKYEHYVDLRGFEDEIEEAPEDYREPARFNVRGKEVKQAFGRQSKADNPIVNMIDQAYRTINRGERNRYLHAVWNAIGRMNAESQGSVSDIAKLDKGKPKKVIDPRTGLVKTVADSSYAGSPNAVSLKISGLPHHIVFENRDMAEAVKRMRPDVLNEIAQKILVMENKLKSLWTHYSPDFLFRHFIFRYPIEGTLNSFEQKEGGEHSIAKFLKESFPFVGTASKAIFASNKGERHDNPEIQQMQDYWDEMRKTGGAMMFRQSRDVDLTREHLEHQLSVLKGGPLSNLRDRHRKAVEAMDVVTNALDNAIRLAAYASARRQGKTPQQSALIAREATVDFQLKGKWANAIGLWFPFGNVATQTGMRMTKAVARSRIMRRVFAGTMLAGFMVAAFNYLIGGDDKDGIPFFEKVPEWDRRLNFIVLNPFERDEKGRPQVYKIPMPYNWAFPLMMGYAFGTTAFGKEYIRKTLKMVARSALEVITPFGQEENTAAILAPEVARPLVYLATNENYNGTPVHQNPDYQKGPNSWSGKRDIGGRVRTGAGFKDIAEGINAATGGNRAKSGMLDMYPEDIRLLFDYVFGSQRRLANNLYETGKSVVKGEAPAPEHVPLERVIRGTDYDAANRALSFERAQKTKHPWLH